MKTLNIALALIASSGLAAAQGTDTCNTPTVAAGIGPWAFDNTAASTGTQGQTEALCGLNGYNHTSIKKDVWFTWNASFTGYAVVTDCGLTAIDSKIGVYPGNTCPTAGTAIGCNDDGCVGPLDSVTNAFPVTMGQDYVIQIGVYPQGTVAGGPGQFDILNVVPPANDSCATPTAIAAPGQYAFDTSYASTGTEGQTESLCNINTPQFPTYRDLWFTYTATTTSVEVKTCDLVNPSSPFTDTRIAVYPGSTCPAPQTAIGCEDDNPLCTLQGYTTTVTFPSTCGATYLIQLGDYNPQASVFGLIEFAEVGTLCNTPFTTSCYGDGSGTACPCGNAGIAGRGCGNGSFANGAELSSAGIASISADTLILKGFNGSAFGAGLYFQGSANSSPAGTAFGHGIVCMSGSTPRLEIVNPQDVNGASQTVGIIHNEGGIAAPGTFHYQWWYRDAVNVGSCSSGGSAFNFSNAITLTWGP